VFNVLRTNVDELSVSEATQRRFFTARAAPATQSACSWGAFFSWASAAPGAFLL